MKGDMGHTRGLINSAPGTKDAELVTLIPVGLPCLKEGTNTHKNKNKKLAYANYHFKLAKLEQCNLKEFQLH